MRPGRDRLIFTVAFLVSSTVLGWLFWTATGSVGGFTLDSAMLAVPVVSAMLCARGFGWKRKAVYVAVTLGVYLLVGVAAGVTGFHAVAARELNSVGPFPSVPTMLYLAFLTVFPLVMLVLFVGRNPALLWERKQD